MNLSHPSIEDIKIWAYSDKNWPHQEWDLFLSWTREVDLFIELATDHKCLNHQFFLHMLYFIVGATYEQSENPDNKIDRIKSYAEKGKGIAHGAIQVWCRRIEELLAHKIKYDYESWRGGVFADYCFK